MKRRSFIKKSILGAGAGFYISHGMYAKNKGPVYGHGTHRYRQVQGWGIPPTGTPKVKDCHEMVMDSRKRLFMITNETENNILIYDTSGKIIGTWGNEFPGGHGLTLANENGEEFLFITDHKRGIVCKTTLEGKIIMQLQAPLDTGHYTEQAEYKPTEVAVAPNGDFYVADGYGKQYIIHYDAQGKVKNVFGGKGEQEQHLNVAHGVTVDLRNPADPMLVVSSRADNCFKLFNMDGSYRSILSLPGAWNCRAVIKGNNLYSAVLICREPWNSGTGYLTILDKNNRVISNPGGTPPVYEKGVLQKMEQALPALFTHPHDVCVDGDENLYIPQWNSGNTYPIKLERI